MIYCRSPWTNKYFPEQDDGFLPSEKLRAMECEANELFDSYRELYFEGGTSSVYLWDLDTGFAGCFLIKKSIENNRFVSQGGWDSIHVVEVNEISPTKATYKLTTTVMLSMSVAKEVVGSTNMSGSLTRQSELTSAVNDDTDQSHLANIGRLIEELESQCLPPCCLSFLSLMCSMSNDVCCPHVCSIIATAISVTAATYSALCVYFQAKCAPT